MRWNADYQFVRICPACGTLIGIKNILSYHIYEIPYPFKTKYILVGHFTLELGRSIQYTITPILIRYSCCEVINKGVNFYL
jgi:hypothetical protein